MLFDNRTVDKGLPDLFIVLLTTTRNRANISNPLEQLLINLFTSERQLVKQLVLPVPQEILWLAGALWTAEGYQIFVAARRCLLSQDVWKSDDVT